MADTTDSVSRTPPEPSTMREKADIQERGELDRSNRDKDTRNDNRAVDSYRPEPRRRSQSPRPGDRKNDRPRRKDAGFRWKEKRRDDDNDRRERDDGGLRRGYRDQERRDRDERSKRDDRDSGRTRNEGFTHSAREQDRPRRRSRSPERRHDRNRDEREPRKSKIEQTAPAPPAAQQEMIIVYVNDRLGTKKAIPCFATDRIKEFKVIVASMIGRQPHEILLKRQGERPFKDVLTLQDYGVSNNVQLDLEVDTGD